MTQIEIIKQVVAEKGISQSRLSKMMGINPSTLNRILNGKEVLSAKRVEAIAEALKVPVASFDPSLHDNDEEVKANRKELMSEMLDMVPEILALVEADNVSYLADFFASNPEVPLLAVGNGGAYQPAVYATLLYGLRGGIGRAITPFLLNSMSNVALSNARKLLISVGGHNIDIAYAANRVVECGGESALLTMADDEKFNIAASRLRRKGGKVFCFPHPELREGFISIHHKFFFCGLIYKAFTADSDFVKNLDFGARFKYELNDRRQAPSLRSIKSYDLLYGGWGELAACDFESVFAEAGIAATTYTDYRNYCHGRFIYQSNHTSTEKHHEIMTDSAVVMLVSPREKQIAKDLRDNVIPANTPVVTIETEKDGPLAAIELMYQVERFAAYVGEVAFKFNPNSPMNYNNIDKRYPKSGVKFVAEFKQRGPLSLTTEV